MVASADEWTAWQAASVTPDALPPARNVLGRLIA